MRGYSIQHKWFFRRITFVFMGMLCISSALWAHESHQSKMKFSTGPRGLVEVDWPKENFSRIVSAGYPDSFGLSAFLDRQSPLLNKKNGRQCLTTSFLGLDVDDAFAYDVDEIVYVDLLLDDRQKGPLFYSFDANGVTEPIQMLERDAEQAEALQWYRLTLPRARFAGRGMDGTDISLAAAGTFSFDYMDYPSQFTLCDIKITRTGTTKIPIEFGEVDIQIKGEDATVRMGIYDESGRSILPGKMAVPLKFYERTRRHLQFHTFLADNPQPWPIDNHYFFYVDGVYEDLLPVGRYTLIASKGPEYRMQVKSFDITLDQKTKLDITLDRWVDMPAKGWFSGDVHIHIPRTGPNDNDDILVFLSAEGVHVSNLLEMTNPAVSHFKQYAFGENGRASDGEYTIVPGIEGPRTAHRGHAIALDIEAPIIDKDNYFLYHTFLEKYQEQGALNGYAHVGSGEFHDEIGLAIDVPFGLVDFVEIVQNGNLRTEVWYGFLNMGFHLPATAGSDFPYFDQPGSVRTLAHIEGSFSPDAWLKSLKSGHTFATTAPMLEFTVNGQEMGDSISISDGKKIHASGRAWINPDFGSLDEVSIVYCGDIIKTVHASDSNLEIDIQKDIEGKSGWVALVARGPGQAVAHSTPVYLTDSVGESQCKAKAGELATQAIQRLDDFLEAPIILKNELEYWQLDDLEALYEKQKPALTERVEAAKKYYLNMIIKMESNLAE